MLDLRRLKPEIEGREKRYRELQSQWQKFSELVTQQTKSDSFCIQTASKNHDRLEFFLFGKTAFMAFTHDCENGFITYGIVENAANDLRRQDKRVEVYRFDRFGNLEQDNTMTDRVEAIGIHLAALIKLCENEFTAD